VKLPSLSLPNQDDQQVSLQQLVGQPVVLFFYPKDSTPGCTLEAQDFTRLKKEFSKLGAILLGVSRDSVASHTRFIQKCSLGIDLLSDTQEELCQAFDVIKEKNMYGKKVLGVERSTFLFDQQGNLVREWRKVKVDGHAQEVLSELKSHLGQFS
jgi:peroxiredoxin Q/BCP